MTEPLVVRGSVTHRGYAAHRVLTTGVLSVALLFASVWLLSRGTEAPFAASAAGTAFAVFLLLAWKDEQLRVRVATVYFRDGGVEINWSLGARAQHLRWTELRGFRDDDALGVSLVLRTRLPLLETHPFVPTPDEATRTAVLAHLEARGLPRLES